MREVERYELSAGPAYRFEPDRRDFFTLLGGGIVVLLTLADAEGQESGRGGRRRGAGEPQELSAWLHIGADSKVTVLTGKVEVGQNARTALTQAIAEELHVPAKSVVLVMADTDLTPYDMGTFGSRTTPTMAPLLRKAAATAREMLLDLAAERWQADRTQLEIDEGVVRNRATGKKATLAELTAGKDLVRTVNKDAVSQPKGESLAKVNGRDIVTGAHRYTSDLKRPGMLYGAILRPPAYQSKLASLDTKAAEQIAGVHVVHDNQFTGAAAADRESARRALEAMKAEWTTPEAQPSSRDLYAYLKANPEGAPGRRGGRQRGSMDDGWKQSAQRVDGAYHIAYIAHIPLEPRAAVAEWAGDKLTVWTGTQVPFGVRSELAEAFQIPENKVRVIVPDTGSGYGGKHTGECALEAARLAKSAGKPVKVTWSREEEFAWAYFRPGGVIDVSGGVNKEGLITAWEFHNYNSGGSGLDTPYEVPNQNVEFHATKSPLRQGSYRGLAATANHFARESHMDDLARAANLDPLTFRRKNLKDPRMLGVLEAVTERFGWGKSKARANQGFGLSCGFEKGSYVASCAEISLEQGKVKLERVVTAFECGAIVNPEHLKNQVEGSVMMGIGGALFEAVQFESGRLINGKLSRYRVPRFGDMPVVLDTVLVDRKDLPSAGAGETPIVGIAPAIGNAIFNATGNRVRTMPMAPNGLSS